MNDLSVFETAWYEAGKAVSQGVWQRLLACGSEQCLATFVAGRVARYEITSNFTLRALRCSKKGKSWYTREACFEDISSLSLLRKDSEYLFISLEGQNDTRIESEKNGQDRDDAWKTSYDAELAGGLPALIFHRLWRSMRTPFKKGIVFDGLVSWSNGRTGWNGCPLPFAWCDAQQATFSPFPRIDEKMTFYREGAESRRRHILRSTGSVDPVPDLSELCEEVLELHEKPLVAMTPANVDTILLSPNAAFELLTEILPAFCEDELSYVRFSQLFSKEEDETADPDGLKIASDALYPLFRHAQPPLDARGKRTRTVTLYEHGRPAGLVTSDKDLSQKGNVASNPILSRLTRALKPNGHAVDPEGTAAVLYPVMQASSGKTLPAYSRALFGQIAERTLVIESFKLIRTGDSTGRAFVYVPEGGILYVDGAAFGYVQPFRFEMSISALLRSLKAVSSPQLCCGACVCALQLAPQQVFERIFL